MNWQDIIYEELLTDGAFLTPELLKRVADRRFAQADELKASQKEMIRRGRAVDRRGKVSTEGDPNVDVVDLDQRLHIARQGLQGAKDIGIRVPASQRSGVEKRHVPPQGPVTDTDASRPPQKGDKGNLIAKTLISKLDAKGHRALRGAARRAQSR